MICSFTGTDDQFVDSVTQAEPASDDELMTALSEALDAVRAATGVYVEVNLAIESLPERTAIARFKDGTLRIEFDRDRLAQWSSDPEGSLFWNVRAVMAHEFGHVVHGHTTLRSIGRNQERIADRYAGEVLLRHTPSASLDEASRAYEILAPEKGSGSHPPREERLAWVRTGWWTAQSRDALARRRSEHDQWMESAYSSLTSSRFDQAEEFLLEALPGMGETDLRGPGWYHMWALLNDATTSGGMAATEMGTLGPIVTDAVTDDDGALRFVLRRTDADTRDRSFEAARVTADSERVESETLAPFVGEAAAWNSDTETFWVLDVHRDAEPPVAVLRPHDSPGNRGVTLKSPWLVLNQAVSLAFHESTAVIATENWVGIVDTRTGEQREINVRDWAETGGYARIAIASDARLAFTAHPTADEGLVFYQHELSIEGESTRVEIKNDAIKSVNDLSASADGTLLAIATDSGMEVRRRAKSDTIWRQVPIGFAHPPPEWYYRVADDDSDPTFSEVSQAVWVTESGDEVMSAGPGGLTVFDVRMTEGSGFGFIPAAELIERAHLARVPERPAWVGELRNGPSQSVGVLGVRGEFRTWARPLQPSRERPSGLRYSRGATLAHDTRGRWLQYSLNEPEPGTGVTGPQVLSVYRGPDASQIDLPEGQWSSGCLGGTASLLWLRGTDADRRSSKLACVSIAGSNASVRAMDLDTRDSRPGLFGIVAAAGANRAVAVSERSVTLVESLDSDADLRTLSVVTPEQDSATRFERIAALSDDGAYFAYVAVFGRNSAGSRVIVRRQNGNEVVTGPLLSRSRVTSLQFDPSGRYLASVVEGNQLQIMDLRGRVPMLSLPFSGRSSRTSILGFSNDGTTVAVAQGSATPMQLWSVEHGTRVAILPPIRSNETGLVLIGEGPGMLPLATASLGRPSVVRWRTASRDSFNSQLMSRWRSVPDDFTASERLVRALMSHSASQSPGEEDETAAQQVLKDSGLSQQDAELHALWLTYVRDRRLVTPGSLFE